MAISAITQPADQQSTFMEVEMGCFLWFSYGFLGVSGVFCGVSLGFLGVSGVFCGVSYGFLRFSMRCPHR